MVHESVTLVAKNTGVALRDQEGEEVFQMELSASPRAEPLRIGQSRAAEYTKSEAAGIPSLPFDLSTPRSLDLFFSLLISLSPSQSQLLMG